jgi:hypothetical protein
MAQNGMEPQKRQKHPFAATSPNSEARRKKIYRIQLLRIFALIDGKSYKIN